MSPAVLSLSAFSEFVRSAPLGVVATVDPDGMPEAALVSLAVTESGDLLFNSATSARKIVNLRSAPRVAVVIGCTGEESWQVEGVADVESGDRRLASGREYGARFPGSRALAPGFSIVRVRPHWIRRYDAGVDPAHVVDGAPPWVG